VTIHPRTRSKGFVAGTFVLLSALTAPLPSQAAAPIPLYGRILGVVSDVAGTPQMGAAVSLFDRRELLQQRVLTDEKGFFSFDNLNVGAYAVRVSLASFLPVLKDNILVQPGGERLLNVSLASLFSSIEIVYPSPGQRSVMSDDWKWLLRTSSATRPILRLMPDLGPNGTLGNRTSGVQTAFSDTRGLVRVSAGDGGRVTSFGSESDLGTAFALATSLYGNNHLSVSGNVAYGAQSGLPSAGFRTTYSRADDGSSPEVALTMRQLYMPGRIAGAIGGDNVGVPALRTMSLSFQDKTALSDSMQLAYGFALDSVTFFDRLNYASPWAVLRYDLSDGETLEFGYSSGVPHAARANAMGDRGAELQDEITALALFPRVSMREGRAKVQRSENFEVGYTRVVGSRTFRGAVSRENVYSAALTMVGDGVSEFSSSDVLPDLFSNASIFNAGQYKSLGYLASVTQALGPNIRGTLMFSSGGALIAAQGEPATGSPEQLRSMIHAGRRHSVTAQVSGVAPIVRTQFVASYQWSDRSAATPAYYYMTLQTRAEAGLNVYVRQPIPNFASIPVRIEASADLRNLLAQGYLPFTTADGHGFCLMQTPRSVRGGLNFIF
jgi:Carboxypeptidase regulatory-like domain